MLTFQNSFFKKIRFAKAATGSTVINAKSYQNQPESSPSPNRSTSSSPAHLQPQPPLPSQQPKAASASTSASGYPCQYCGKLFSNQSNRRRHAVLSCELARNAGVEPRKSRETVMAEKRAAAAANAGVPASHKTESNINEDFYYEDGAPGSRSMEPQKCPFPDCDVSHMRSALLKRHLYEDHNIQNSAAELSKQEGIKYILHFGPAGECSTLNLQKSA